MCISCEELTALQGLFSEWELIYNYAANRPCEDSNRTIADIVRSTHNTECNRENMKIIGELLKRHKNMCEVS
jgi:hypothetical protein